MNLKLTGWVGLTTSYPQIKLGTVTMVTSAATARRNVRNRQLHQPRSGDQSTVQSWNLEGDQLSPIPPYIERIATFGRAVQNLGCATSLQNRQDQNWTRITTISTHRTPFGTFSLPRYWVEVCLCKISSSNHVSFWRYPGKKIAKNAVFGLKIAFFEVFAPS